MGGNYTLSPGVSLGDPIHLVKHPSKCIHTHTRTHTHAHTRTQQLFRWAQNMDLFHWYENEKLLELCKSHRSWFIWSVLLCSFHRNINKHKERTIFSQKLIPCEMGSLHLWRRLPGQSCFLHSVLRGLLQDLVEWDTLEVQPGKPPSPVYETNNNNKRTLFLTQVFYRFSVRLQLISSANTTAFL